MRSLMADLGDALARGFTWWTGELASFLPARLSAGGSGRTADVTVLVHSGRFFGMIPALAVPATGDGSGIEAAILDQISLRRARGPVRVRLRLALSDCLVRSITVPKAAAKDIARIAELDLERATPFRSGDVQTALLVTPARRDGSAVTAEQIVVKRSKVAALRSKIEALGAQYAGLEFYREDPLAPLTAALMSETEPAAAGHASRWLPSAGSLAAISVTLGLAALVISTLRHEQALATLKEQSEAVRTRIAQARSRESSGEMAVAAAYATFRNDRPPAVVLIEDLTRRIPDSAYVDEFRFADGSIELGGFGRPVRTLAPELEQSQFVESASITAPITTDEQRQKERFSLRLRLGGREEDSGPQIAPTAVDGATP